MKSKQKTRLNHYLEVAKMYNIMPNFFMSLAYLQASNAQAYTENNWIWIEDEDWCLFPPLRTETEVGKYPAIEKVWASFLNGIINLDGSYAPYVLDCNYIFDPVRFQDLSGKEWATFRKNIRKWPRRNPNSVYIFGNNPKQMRTLLGLWLEKKMEVVEDADVICKLILEDNSNVFKKCLYNSDNKLVAINCWDSNWKYINYRLCITLPDEPFLEEFARYSFYTDPVILREKKLINDGGDLGNLGLEKFKKKMNPVSKFPIYSLIKNG